MSEQDNPWETGFQPPQRTVVSITSLLDRIRTEQIPIWDQIRTREILTNNGERDIVVGVDYEVTQGTEAVVGGNYDQLKTIAAVFGEHPGNLLGKEPRYVTLEANGKITTARLVVIPLKPPQLNTLAMTVSVIEAIEPEGGEVVITELFQRIQDVNLDRYV